VKCVKLLFNKLLYIENWFNSLYYIKITGFLNCIRNLYRSKKTKIKTKIKNIHIISATATSDTSLHQNYHILLIYRIDLWQWKILLQITHILHLNTRGYENNITLYSITDDIKQNSEKKNRLWFLKLWVVCGSGRYMYNLRAKSFWHDIFIREWHRFQTTHIKKSKKVQNLSTLVCIVYTRSQFRGFIVNPFLYCPLYSRILFSTCQKLPGSYYYLGYVLILFSVLNLGQGAVKC
jgi:hypothetical protein